MSRGKASATAQAAGFSLIVSSYEPSNTLPADHVTRQVPEAGSHFATGWGIQVVLSLGVQVRPVEVPDVRSKSREEAEQLLAAAEQQADDRPSSRLPVSPSAGKTLTTWAALSRSSRVALAIAALGLLGVFVLSLVLPAHTRKRRVESVKHAMRVIQTALEAYSTDHNGNYPGRDRSWLTSGDDILVSSYFPGGDPFGVDGSPLAGQLPINPYTREQYRDGHDLFYGQASCFGVLREGAGGLCQAGEAECPYRGLRAPNGVSGTIVILTHVPKDSPSGAVLEYGICGFGPDANTPLHHVPAGMPNEPRCWEYFVLHN
jgi:hypothetical protein